MNQYQIDPPCPECGRPGCICSDDAETEQGDVCQCGRRQFCNDSYYENCASFLGKEPNDSQGGK